MGNFLLLLTLLLTGFSYLALMLVEPRKYCQGPTPQGKQSHKHSHEPDLNPEPGGFQLSTLTTAPSDRLLMLLISGPKEDNQCLELKTNDQVLCYKGR